MSMSRLALRMAAVRSIRGATLAGARVFDSDADPLDQRLATEGAPIIIVYTDDHQENPSGRADMAGGGTNCDLVIEFAITGEVSAPIDGEPGFTIPETSAGTEIALDIVERQIIAALTARQGVWPELWRLFCVAIRRRVSRRAAVSDSGVRFAARQLVLTCDMLIDPTPGASMGAETAWGRWMQAMADDPNLAAIGALIGDVMQGDGEAGSHILAAAILGVNVETTGDLGIGPVYPGEGLAPLTDGDIEEGFGDA